MNIAYILQELEKVKNLLGNMNVIEHINTYDKQKRINEAYSIIFDLTKMLKE